MNCEQIRLRLDANATHNTDDEQALLDHLRDCEACRDHAEERRLVSLLRALPIREPHADFEARALQAALAQLSVKRPAAVPLAWPLAMAASLALAVIVTLRLATPDQGVAPTHMQAEVTAPMQVFTVSARPMQTRIVDVVLDSKRALENATLVVSLDENLMLENRAGVRELRWQTNIKAGGNKLSLPVQLLDAADGEMIVTLEHGNTRQQVKVEVKEEISGSALPQVSI